MGSERSLREGTIIPSSQERKQEMRKTTGKRSAGKNMEIKLLTSRNTIYVKNKVYQVKYGQPNRTSGDLIEYYLT